MTHPTIVSRVESLQLQFYRKFNVQPNTLYIGYEERKELYNLIEFCNNVNFRAPYMSYSGMQLYGVMTSNHLACSYIEEGAHNDITD